MVFSDLFFLFVFLPSFLGSYLVGTWLDSLMSPPNERCMTFKNAVLIIFSLLFYAWGEPVYVFLMLGSVLINYIIGRCIAVRDGRGRKTALVVGLVCNVLILGVFKYAGFFADMLIDCGVPIVAPKIALPIGISFYTFQAISYLVDVYRREARVQESFYDLLLYISMFPQLIAGPIVRYGTIAEEINRRSVSSKDFADGLYRFFIGLGKKVIIANQFSEIVDQFLLNGYGNMTTSGAWLGILAFALQIYFDFSGYSDMAIGLGRCMGFHFNENFNHPYCCNSITDFWRRWHISLGSFFRDYVYIPLGGNRRHQMVNILAVWFLTGMWHGASWNFILWGLYFGLLVAFEKYTVLKLKHVAFLPFRHVYALLMVLFGWAIFYFDDLDQIIHFFNVGFGNTEVLHNAVTECALTDRFGLWVVALLLVMPVRRWLHDLVLWFFGDISAARWIIIVARTLITVVLLSASVALLVGATNNAFIYTRF